MEEKEKFEQCIEKVEIFVTENFHVTGINDPCGNAEIEADDYKGSYDKAKDNLYKELKKLFQE